MAGYKTEEWVVGRRCIVKFIQLLLELQNLFVEEDSTNNEFLWESNQFPLSRLMSGWLLPALFYRLGNLK